MEALRRRRRKQKRVVASAGILREGIEAVLKRHPKGIPMVIGIDDTTIIEGLPQRGAPLSAVSGDRDLGKLDMSGENSLQHCQHEISRRAEGIDDIAAAVGRADVTLAAELVGTVLEQLEDDSKTVVEKKNRAFRLLNRTRTQDNNVSKRELQYQEVLSDN